MIFSVIGQYQHNIGIEYDGMEYGGMEYDVMEYDGMEYDVTKIKRERVL